ncbi:hypothetical protein MASR1M31_02400 [Porphyromonadaceae bacterium]
MITKMWDSQHGGFYWMCDRKGNVKIDKKIIYGHSFAIYSLSEYTLATGDKRGIEYAEKVFALLQLHCVDSMHGGYWEMFERIGHCVAAAREATARPSTYTCT